MALVIPDLHSNWILTVSNSAGGLSSRSTISFGLAQNTALDLTAFGVIANLFRDGLKPIWDNAWSVGPTHVVEGLGSGPDRIWDDSGTEVGTATGINYGSPAQAHVVSKYSGFSGRNNRGRVYLPGVAESDVDEAGVLLSARVTAVQTIMDDLQTSVVAHASIDSFVIFHDETTPSASIPTQMERFVSRPVIGNMRPRQRR